MWDLIVSVPDHCLSFYFSPDKAHMMPKYKVHTLEILNSDTL